MAICPNCGTSNQAGSTTCVQCGKPLEVIPDWLELLLARYGEVMPTFEGISVEREPAVAPTQPLAAQPTSSDTSRPSAEVEPVDADLLDELEQLKQLSRQAPPTSAEAQPSEEASAAAAPPPASKGADEWLAELRALQDMLTSEKAAAPSSEEPAPETAPPVSRETPGERESSPPLESLVESAPTPQGDMVAEEAPLPSLEERLGAVTSPAHTAESTSEETMPEWLRTLGLVQAEQPPMPPSGEPDQLSEMLGPLPVAEAEHVGGAGEGASDEEIPDWLKRLIAISSQAPESPSTGEEAEPTQTLVGDRAEAMPTVEPTPEEELPDWLRELEARQTTQLSAPTIPEEREILPLPPEAPSAEVPETPAGPLPGAEEGAMAAVGEEAVPPTVAEEQSAKWLAELEELIERPPTSVSPLPPPPPPVVEEEEVPDWLRELAATKPERPSLEPEAQAPVVPEIPQPEPAVLPDWLIRLRPSEPPAEVPSAEAAAPSPPAGGTPDEQDVIETLRARLGVPQVPDTEGAAMFRDIVSEPSETPLTPVPEEVAPTPRRSVVSIIVWALVFVVLLLGIALLSLAVLARLQELLGETAFQRFLNTPAAAGLIASLDQFRKPIMALRPGDVVLLSMDYTPATAAEMQPLASVVLHDLLARKARVLTVSLQPEGAPLAQRLLDEVSSTYPYGQYTLNLGYLPGDAVGVRSLAHVRTRPLYRAPDGTCQSLHTCPGWDDIQSVKDITLFITVADAAESARWWVEQLPRMSSDALPMLAAMSAAALPAARPYLTAVPTAPSRWTGLIGGMMATAAYEVYTDRPGRALHMVAAQSAAHLALVAVALAGIFAGVRARTGSH